MTVKQTITEVGEELYLCEKMAVLVSETSRANDQYQDDSVAQYFRAIAAVGQDLASKLLQLRCRMDDLERMTRPDTAKSDRETAAQHACESAHEAVREIESPIAKLEQQMIILDMMVETMIGSRSTESAGAGLSNLQGSMNHSIAEINETWTKAHEATKALKEGAQTAKEEGNG